MWTDGYIAVDWGTTNRRAWRVRAGAVEEEFADDLGFTSVPPGGFPAEVATVRQRLGDLPLLMAGMVGARGGWVPAPYLPCPLDLATLNARRVAALAGLDGVPIAAGAAGPLHGELVTAPDIPVEKALALARTATPGMLEDFLA